MSVEPLSSPALGAGFERVMPAAARSALVRYRGLLGVVYALLDAATVALAFCLAYWVRYLSSWSLSLPFGLGDFTLNLPVGTDNFLALNDYTDKLVTYVLLVVGVLALRGTYTRRFLRSLWDEATGAVAAAVIAVAVLIVVNYYNYLQIVTFSRLMFLYVGLFTALLLVGTRLLGRGIKGWLHERGIGLRQTLIVGGGPQARAIMRSLLAQPALGFRVMGYLDDEHRRNLGRIAHLGEPSDLRRVIESRRPDEVIIALPAARHEEIAEHLRACAASRAHFRLVPDFFELSLNQVDTQYLDGIPLIGVRELHLGGHRAFLKRSLDVAIAGLGLLATSPVLGLAALLVRLESPGPVFYRQTRVGKGGREFTLYKFRSMYVDAEARLAQLARYNEAEATGVGGTAGGEVDAGARDEGGAGNAGATRFFKMKDDPRRTKVGSWLRRLSVDELPQLWNVLRGDMSLVGPRPPLPSEVALYEDWHRHRLAVAPGLTGIWQVSGRSEVPFDEMVLLDLWYIEHWSLALDLKLLVRTVPAVLLARGAY